MFKRDTISPPAPELQFIPSASTARPIDGLDEDDPDDPVVPSVNPDSDAGPLLRKREARQKKSCELLRSWVENQETASSPTDDLAGSGDTCRSSLASTHGLRFDESRGAWVDSDDRPVSVPQFMNGRSVLAMLGIYGWASIEDAILAGLAVGEPILLIGGPGCAKTLMAECIAKDLGMRFIAYDASKAMFEDILGFIDPASLAVGSVKYVDTPLSLWDKEFILIDEVSRATPALQNRWLEVIWSRRVMGVPLPNLRYVFGAMNPAGMAGTVPLDDALAGRFMFHIDVPELHQMTPEDQRAVVEAGLHPDDFGFCRGSRLRFIIEAVREKFADVEKRFGKTLTVYILAFATYLKSKDIVLDGRRLGLMRRAFVGLVAVREVLNGITIHSKDLDDVLRHGLSVTLPFKAADRDVSRVIIDGGHRYSIEVLRGNPGNLMMSDLIACVRMIEKGLKYLTIQNMSRIVTRIHEDLRRPRDLNSVTRAGLAAYILVCSRQAMLNLPDEARHRMMTLWSGIMEVRAGELGGFASQLKSVAPPHFLPENEHETFMRLVEYVRITVCSSRLSDVEFEEVFEKMTEMLAEGGM